MVTIAISLISLIIWYKVSRGKKLLGKVHPKANISEEEIKAMSYLLLNMIEEKSSFIINDSYKCLCKNHGDIR